MKVLILDDDTRICNMIKVLLEKNFSNHIETIDVCYTSKQALDFLENNDYQLLLLDVHLGKKTTSFDILQFNKHHNASIIFITGHENYAINAIKEGAVDYLLKPIQIKEFNNAIEKALNRISKENLQHTTDYLLKLQNDSIMLKDAERMQLTKLNNILFLKASGAYTEVYLNNKQKVTVSKHLKDFENKLQNFGFYRIHNSFIINTLKIKEISKKDGYAVILENNNLIHISGRRKDNFLKYLKVNLEI